jgi:hypothetical protein
VGTELEALQTFAACVRELVLGNDDGSSSLAASLSMVAELLEGDDVEVGEGNCSACI